MAETTQNTLLPRRCSQNGRSIAAYYDEFNAIWNERNEDDKTRHFLMGLDHLRSNLLAKRPLPSLSEAYELLLEQGKRHLPADLFPCILSRLPVKSLMRFRCVSKPWLALVDEDPQFAALHLDVFNKNSDESKLLVVESNNECFVRCSDTLEPVWEIPFYSPNRWTMVSYVDGLVLLEGKETGALKLWNPSIRQFRNIKPHPPLEIPNMGNVVGFGYDPLSRDYKVVKLLHESGGLMHSVLVCSVGAGSWKTIPFQVKGFPCPILYWNLLLTNAIYLHAGLHFVARDSIHNPSIYFMSFDLSNEVFSWINMPPDVRLGVWPNIMLGAKLILIYGGSSIAVYDHFARDDVMWVLEMKNMKWTRQCRYVLKNAELFYVKKNGDMLILRSHEEFFLNKTGCRKSSLRSEVALYCLDKLEYKILLEKERTWRLSWMY